MEHGVGKAEVLAVIVHGHGHVPVAHAGEKQHQVVGEVVAQFLVHVAHRAHLQQAAQRCAGGHRHAGDDVEQALGFLVHHGAQADVVVVAGFAQPDGVGVGLLAAHEFPGFAGIHVGAEAAHAELFAQKLGLEFEILLGRTKGDGDHFFHINLLASKRANQALALRLRGGLAAGWTAGARGSTCRIRSSHCARFM